MADSTAAAGAGSFQGGTDQGDEADSRPQHSTGEVNPRSIEGMADNDPRPSVASASAYAQDSSDPLHQLDAEVMSSPAATAPDSPRPTDEAIIHQQNAIREEQAQRPFIGPVEPVQALQEEYQRGSQVFLAKIVTLEGLYGSIRRTRGDGNCFFRSFMFAYMEGLVHTQDWKERDRVIAAIRSCRPQMLAIYQDMIFDEPLEELIRQLQALSAEAAVAQSSLEAVAGDDMLSNTMVMFLRLLTGSELQKREEFFAPFVMGMSDDLLSVESFRQRYVEPMGEESDHVHIVALTDALQVPIRVMYLDRSASAFSGATGAAGDSAEVNHHDFVPEALAGAAGMQPRVHLLYRPGHFDCLYPRA